MLSAIAAGLTLAATLRAILDAGANAAAFLEASGYADRFE